MYFFTNQTGCRPTSLTYVRVDRPVIFLFVLLCVFGCVYCQGVKAEQLCSVYITVILTVHVMINLL